jgi:MFS family permease
MPVTPLLALDNLLGNLGQYSLVPVLGVLIATQDHGTGTGAVGIGLSVYFAAVGVSCLLVSRWLPRFRYTTAMCASAVLAAVGFGLLAFMHAFGALLVMLLVAGFGVSVHVVLARVLIAEHTSGDVERTRAYSLMNISINIAGAVGPFVASLLYVSGDGRPLVAMVATCYLLGAAVLLIGLPRVLRQAVQRPAPTGSAWPVSRAGVAAVMRHPQAWRTVVVATLATFLYAQFYSAFALLVADQVTSSLLRAVLLSGPAIAIVVLQHAVTAVVSVLLRRGTRPVTLLGAATLVFGVSFGALGVGLPLVAACLLSVALFALAEMVFTPMLNTAFAALPFESRLEALNFRQVCWTVGESLGSLCGGTLFLLLSQGGHGRIYWLALGAAAIVSTLFLFGSVIIAIVVAMSGGTTPPKPLEPAVPPKTHDAADTGAHQHVAR